MYYEISVDPNILTSLSSIAAHQAKPMEQTMKKVKQLLDYAASHPYAVLKYQAIEMVLVGHGDASYLSKTNTRSRAGENLFLYNNTELPPNNGAVLTICQNNQGHNVIGSRV